VRQFVPNLVAHPCANREEKVPTGFNGLSGKISARAENRLDVDAYRCVAVVARNRQKSATSIFPVLATNSPIVNRLAVHRKQAPYRTHAIAALLAPGRVALLDTHDPYHYVRLQNRSRPW
jgi:hypothetical protein